MTIHQIQVNEYECELCGYRWINRVNGKDKPIPERCAKCKKFGWDDKLRQKRILERKVMTSEEIGLRTRIKKLHRVYYSLYRYHTKPYDEEKLELKEYWDFELLFMFITLDNPRPAVRELKNVLYPPGVALGLDSQNLHRLKQMVPDPSRPGWLKYNPDEFPAVLESDKQKIFSAMKKMVIEQHGKGWRKKAKRTLKEIEKEREKQKKKREQEIQEEIKKHPEMKEYYESIANLGKQLQEQEQIPQ